MNETIEIARCHIGWLTTVPGSPHLAPRPHQHNFLSANPLREPLHLADKAQPLAGRGESVLRNISEYFSFAVDEATVSVLVSSYLSL